MQGLNREKYNEQLNKETVTRWQEVEARKTINNRTVIEWLNTWGTDQENCDLSIDLQCR